MYGEVLRFKKSFANSPKGGYRNGVLKNNTLFQVISNNFKTEISPQNYKSQTHCLATILTKTPDLREALPHTRFQRLTKGRNDNPN